MGHCPFCKGAVPEETLRLGGSCPHCLIEIPGEEAATDPGAQALERQAVEEQASRGGRGPLVAVAVLFLLGGGGAAAWFLRPADPVPVADADEWAIVPLAAHQDQFQDDEVEDPGAPAVANGVATSGAASGTHSPAMGGQIASSDGGGSSSPGRASMNPAGGTLSEQVANVDPTAHSPGMVAGPSISVGTRGAQETLTDPNEIAEMVKRVVGRNGKQLEDCYNDRLKAEAELEGRWRVAFEIQPNGSTAKVQVSALAASDSTLESCLVGKVERWRFSPIAQAQAVSKTYNFQH
ncbi:MAG: AgmX/PglI C-terminal domain-containing protein [Alphaproteobacteria bacterium]|nr:AgmX/PglI C-terminal domain-containing protein [Alphaproteobacteria bacterium]